MRNAWQVFRTRLRLPKTAETKQEALVLGILAVLFLLALLPALGYASREYRDGTRRQLLREVKTELEQWFNRTGGFPLHPSGDLGRCGSTEDPDDWFFADVLPRERGGQALLDPRHGAGHFLAYCPTVLRETEGSFPPLAAGFFLEARLENRRLDHAGFNDEHNMFERTLTADHDVFYRICGGAETQCGTEKPADS